ncbi:hypothetical protein [Parafrankia elaeagni]|uniref:hypothetical protein n=1 Tax=Parafrankia elaeagni TaxID=222534 RepID=UPI0003810DB1|nr:hypothetical protein [Parafrankia elaeagni]
MITTSAATITAESLDRVQAAIDAARRRAANQTKRARRAVGVDARNRRKLRRLDGENQETSR